MQWFYLGIFVLCSIWLEMARFMRRKCVQLRSSLEKIFLHNNFSLTTVVTSPPLHVMYFWKKFLFFFCKNNYFYTGSNFYKADPWKIKAPQGDLWIFRVWSWWRSIVTQYKGKMWNILKGEWFWSLISGLQCSYHIDDENCGDDIIKCLLWR